jgi:hypothetical protein
MTFEVFRGGASKANWTSQGVAGPINWTPSDKICVFGYLPAPNGQSRVEFHIGSDHFAELALAMLRSNPGAAYEAFERARKMWDAEQ